MNQPGSQGFQKSIEPSDVVNWDVVREIVKMYGARHPEETAGCVVYVKQARKKLLDPKFATMSKESGMRLAYELPPSLQEAISFKYPLALKGRNLRKFLGEFPQFRVAEKL